MTTADLVRVMEAPKAEDVSAPSVSSFRRFFRRLAVVTVATDLLFTFGNPWGGDQGFWHRWIGQLQTFGFAGFEGNYPPGYVLWLWTVGKLLSLCHIPLERGFTLKFLCVWPVVLVHLAIVRILYRVVEPRLWAERTKRQVLWAAAVNPALLAVGPSWGQVDLLPTVFILLSLVACWDRRLVTYSMPLFVAAMLIKFQVIAFLPVLTALQLREIRRTWRGIPLAVGLVVAAFLPFLVTGNARRLVDNAYVHVGSQYQFATYNAANLWMLLGGNLESWAHVPFMRPVEVTRFPLVLLTPNYLGKTLFVLVSLVVFRAAFRSQRLSQAAMLATVMAAAFFFLLPAMHERYLVMAIPVSLLWLATDARVFPWVGALTAVAFVNVGMVLAFSQGDRVRIPLSLVALVVFSMLLLRALAPLAWERLAPRALMIELPFWLPDALVLTSLLVCLFVGFRSTRPHVVVLPADDVWVYSLPMLEHHQEYGQLQIEKSVGGHMLRVGGLHYQNGIGTHAPSDVTFALPKNARRFMARVGLDEETKNGKVAFIVKLDGKEIWRSPKLRQSDKPVTLSLDVTGGTRLTLATDRLGSSRNDHADWITPRIRLSR